MKSADKTPAPEQPRMMSDSQMLRDLPFLTIPALEHLGGNTTFINTDADNTPFYSATGCPIYLTHELLRQQRAIYLLDRQSIYRLNAALWPVMNTAFNMTAFTDLVPALYAAHALQFVMVLLSNRAKHEKVDIANRILALGSRSVPTIADRMKLQSDIYALSILHRIINGKNFFSDQQPLLPQVLDGLQRGVHVNKLPHRIQAEFMQATQCFQARFQRKAPVSATAVLVRLMPILATVAEPDDPGPDPIHSALLSGLVPPDMDRVPDRTTQFSESALVAAFRPRPPQSTTTDRQRPTSNGARHDDRPPYERRDPRPDAGRPRLVDRIHQDEHPSSTPTMETLQRSMATLQSQLARQIRQTRKDEDAKSSRSESRHAFGSAHMAAKTSSVPDNQEDAERAFFALGSTVYDELPCRMDSDDYSD